MKQITLMEKYPLFVLELNKEETVHKSVDEIINYLKEKIETHPVAVYIATFDHYAHTTSLQDGEIAPNIRAAKNIVFCFGKELPKPEVMGVRPRSIGVADLGEKFVISFLEAPNPVANNAMEEWVKSLKR
ncbi:MULTISPECIES: DUF6858 family protein [unclassified Nitratiruptor]|uniref:DUF6858 family protein n=1 Tax=unclassified Nitratiruptor TaxID=2624044 RepID=UPI001914F126|nr:MULTISPECIES: hypothetical protein [unclassified Nitratiruptor]BCD59313.1 hypothetical protein NitYY0810_C0043 [Nitratiruptor sp. YY08-10]BCD63237.1 hypothetical protein NitYY0814_C0043 [Nitratiruptor sp. YY08-14]